MEFANRFCDWLSDVSPNWINGDYMKSTFYLHYVGEKTTETLKKDSTLWKCSKSRAVLHWEGDSFKVTVRDKDKWSSFAWKEKGFSSLGGISKKLQDTQGYKGHTPKLYHTTLFDRLKLKDPTSNVYQQAEDPSKFASVNVI